MGIITTGNTPKALQGTKPSRAKSPKKKTTQGKRSGVVSRRRLRKRS